MTTVYTQTTHKPKILALDLKTKFDPSIANALTLIFYWYKTPSAPFWQLNSRFTITSQTQLLVQNLQFLSTCTSVKIVRSNSNVMCNRALLFFVTACSKKNLLQFWLLASYLFLWRLSSVSPMFNSSFKISLRVKPLISNFTQL